MDVVVSGTDIARYFAGHLERLSLDDVEMLLSVDQTMASLRRLGKHRFGYSPSWLNCGKARAVEKLKTSVLNERAHEIIAQVASMPHSVTRDNKSGK